MPKRRCHTLSSVLVVALFLSYICPSPLKGRTASSTGDIFVAPKPGVALTMVDEDKPKASPALSRDFVLKASAAAGAAIIGTWITEQPLPGSTGKMDLPSRVEVRRFLHIPIKWMQRMTEKWLGPVNFDRASLRISAMDTYALVAGFLLSTVMGLFGNIAGSPPPDDAHLVEKYNYDAQVLLTVVSALCATWTLVIFLFNKLYCVKAISMYHDVNYAVFLSATRQYRLRAFQLLVTSLITYILAYGSVLGSTAKGKKGIAGGLFVIVFGYMMIMEGSSLISDAESLLGETPLATVEGDNFLK